MYSFFYILWALDGSTHSFIHGSNFNIASFRLIKCTGCNRASPCFRSSAPVPTSVPAPLSQILWLKSQLLFLRSSGSSPSSCSMYHSQLLIQLLSQSRLDSRVDATRVRSRTRAARAGSVFYSRELDPVFELQAIELQATLLVGIADIYL